MNENMHLSPAGAGLVKAFEGCLKPIGGGKFTAYVCPAGVLTLGWGHTNDNGRQFTRSSVWTQADCDAVFLEDMRVFERAVIRLVTVPLSQNQFDALTSFAYNCGAGNLGKSTLLRKVNLGDFASAATEFAKWNKGAGKVLPGLVRRRASESLLFRGIPDAIYDGKPDVGGARALPLPMPQQVDNPDEHSADAGTDEVRTLQAKLAGLGYALKIDGSFGAGTESAVKAFQRDRGLTADGVVGDDTWAALDSALPEVAALPLVPVAPVAPQPKPKAAPVPQPTSTPIQAAPKGGLFHALAARFGLAKG